MNSPSIAIARKKLGEVFGYSGFRFLQEAAIGNLLEGKNTFVLMPTGGGKSLCYQIPALVQPGVAIVISPLIALMKNQVDHLRTLGIEACCLNSTLPKRLANQIKQQTLEGRVKLLYVAPESLTKEDTISFLKQTRISFIAIDEAHCISDWGHDFRPEYRNIRSAIETQGRKLPIIALTATATPRVQKDILKNLEMEKAQVFQSSFNRANLCYEIQSKVEPEKQLVKFIHRHHPGASGIVYCQSRKKVEEMADILNLNGIRAAPYHAGLEAKVRTQNQDAFLNRAVDVVVATIAFGMGIDKPDVRFVVHHDAPGSLEGYYQETGRAGRDGQPSTCLMLYSAKDVAKLARFSQRAYTDKDKTLIEHVEQYAVSGVCRRKQLLHYFGETFNGVCRHCDNCLKPTESYAAADFVRTLLTAIGQVKERFGIEHIVQFLQGEKTPHIKSYAHDALSAFGTGRAHSIDFWRSMVYQSLLHGLLHKEVSHAAPLLLTEAGKAFLLGAEEVHFQKDRVYETDIKAPVKPQKESTAHKEVLLTHLKNLRNHTAQDRGIPAYTVFRDDAIEEMALVCPTTPEMLSRIGGVSMSKARKFGVPFLQAIQAHVETHGILPKSEFLVKSSAKQSKNKVYIIQQIDRKTDLEEMAAARSLSMEELIKEIEQLCYAGTKLNLDYYINTILSREQQQIVYDHFMRSDTGRIQHAKDEFKGEFEEEELRLVRIKFLSEVAN